MGGCGIVGVGCMVVGDVDMVGHNLFHMLGGRRVFLQA